MATAAAYAVSTGVLGHQQAFFAPVAAVIVIIAGAGQRARTLIELVVGVALGVLVGELLILLIGRGGWQIATVVALTVVAATLVGLKGLALTQAANSSVLLAAVVPAAGAGNPAVTRFLDAIVGGLCGLAMVLLLPRNPVRDIDTQVQRLLDRLADVLERTARALRTGDAGLAEAALVDARGAQSVMDDVSSTALLVVEIARMSPVRWRQRGDVARYIASVPDLDNALRDSRVLARRAGAMLRHGEPAPPGLADAVDQLAAAVRVFAHDVAIPAIDPDADAFVRARPHLVDAARSAVTCLTGQMTLNSAAVAAQVRSLAADLLRATGLTRDDLDTLLDFGATPPLA